MSQPQQPYPLQPAAQAGALAVPEFLTSLAKPSDAYWKDMGDIEPNDFGLNFLKVVQGMSKQAKAGWGPTGQEQPLPQGTYFLDKTATVIPEGTHFIPLLRSVTFIKFKGKNTRDGIEFLTKDRNDPRIRAIHGLDWTEKDGDRIPPSVTKFVNFYVATIFNLAEPAVLSFHKTSTKLGQQLTRDITMATNLPDGRKLPFYTTKFKLLKSALVQDGGNEWYQMRYQGDGFVKQESIPTLQRLYEMALVYETASKGIAVTEEGDVFSGGTDETPAAPVQQPQMSKATIITVTPTPAPAAAAPQTIVQPQVQQQAPVAAPAPLITPPAPAAQAPAQQAPAPAPVATVAGW